MYLNRTLGDSVSMPKGYFNPALPEEMKQQIDKIIFGRKELGYKSVSEFVKDAVRRRIEEIEKE